MASPSKKKSSKISRRTSAKITPGKSPGKIQKPGDMRVMGRKRILNVLGDPPDIRDRIYEPPLIKLEHSMEDNMVPSLVRDQDAEGACTGFGLAAVIDLLNFKEGEREFRASTRMLYEMAKKHDEWPGEDYDGSSCRGAIRGWHNMGVCEEGNWPYEMSGADRELTIDRAVAARKNTLGAYYRLQAEIVDYHAALNETGRFTFPPTFIAAGLTPPRGKANCPRSSSSRSGRAVMPLPSSATTARASSFKIPGAADGGRTASHFGHMRTGWETSWTVGSSVWRCRRRKYSAWWQPRRTSLRKSRKPSLSRSSAWISRGTSCTTTMVGTSREEITGAPGPMSFKRSSASQGHPVTNTAIS